MCSRHCGCLTHYVTPSPCLTRKHLPTQASVVLEKIVLFNYWLFLKLKLQLSLIALVLHFSWSACFSRLQKQLNAFDALCALFSPPDSPEQHLLRVPGPPDLEVKHNRTDNKNSKLGLHLLYLIHSLASEISSTTRSPVWCL